MNKLSPKTLSPEMKLVFEVEYTLDYENVSTNPDIIKISWSFLSSRISDREENSGCRVAFALNFDGINTTNSVEDRCIYVKYGNWYHLNLLKHICNVLLEMQQAKYWIDAGFYSV